MKNLDILIVRIMPFILYLTFGIYLILGWCRVDTSILSEFHGNSALYALSLYLISLSNKRYHCKWNRAMYLFLIIVPIFNFSDAVFDYIPDRDCYLAVITGAFALTGLWSAYKAIGHFILTYRRKHGKRNGKQTKV